MSSVKSVRLQNIERINRLRRVQRILETEAFASAYEFATTTKKREVEGWIYLGNTTLIESWLGTSDKSVDTMSLRQLRMLAKDSGVQYYTRLTRYELIREIQDVTSTIPSQDRSNTTGNGTFGDGPGTNLPREIQQTIS